MRKYLLLLLLSLAAPSFAVEVAGVTLQDRAQVGDADLRLNGAGVRTRFLFKVYVAGLYLGVLTHRQDDILADAGPKRVTLVMKRKVSSKDLLDAFNQGMTANNTPVRLKALEVSIKNFSAIFDFTREVSEGDVINIDYLPGYGTRVTINGEEKGQVEGLEFNRALLRVWLGDNPVDSGLKEDLLGE